LCKEFIDVYAEKLCVPVGDWGGAVGQLMVMQYMTRLQTVKMLMVQLKLSATEEFDELLAEWEKETRDGTSVMCYYVAHAQVSPSSSLLTSVIRRASFIK
jgi:hypothetical protein